MPGSARDSSKFGRTMKTVAALCVACILGLPNSVAAQLHQDGAVRADQPIGFDIAAQPLPKALYAFSAVTGIEVLVDAREAAGRVSAGVKGVLAPRDALEILLVGSSLVAQEFGPDTVTVRAGAPRPLAPALAQSQGSQSPYFADIQRAVQLALCSDVRTAPGSYRAALRLWVGRFGTILQSKRLDTTGDDAVDAAIDTALRGVSIGRPPPGDLVQPIALVISPRHAGDPAACPGGIAASRRASSR